jgi:hypothetical protein
MSTHLVQHFLKKPQPSRSQRYFVQCLTYSVHCFHWCLFPQGVAKLGRPPLCHVRPSFALATAGFAAGCDFLPLAAPAASAAEPTPPTAFAVEPTPPAAIDMHDVPKEVVLRGVEAEEPLFTPILVRTKHSGREKASVPWFAKLIVGIALAVSIQVAKHRRNNRIHHSLLKICALTRRVKHGALTEALCGGTGGRGRPVGGRK